MTREFLVVEDEDDYGQIILSLAANEVSPTVPRTPACTQDMQDMHHACRACRPGGGAAVVRMHSTPMRACSTLPPQATVFWMRMRQLQEENLTVHVTVDSANRGGLLVKYGPYDGFVPVSQFGPVSA